jgi:hypothetical protein
MPLTAYGKNNALKGATEKMKYVGLFSSAAYAPTSETAVNGTVINLTGAKAKGFVNGASVVFRELTGSVTGLVATRPYYVVGEATNGFEVALEEGGTAVKVTGHALEATGTKVALLTELSGGSYARVAATWGSASAGEISDTAVEAIKVPAGSTVTDAGWWEKSSGGTGSAGLQATAKLEHEETFTGEGEYKVTSDKLEAAPTVA